MRKRREPESLLTKSSEPRAPGEPNQQVETVHLFQERRAKRNTLPWRTPRARKQAVWNIRMRNSTSRRTWVSRCRVNAAQLGEGLHRRKRTSMKPTAATPKVPRVWANPRSGLRMVSWKRLIVGSHWDDDHVKVKSNRKGLVLTGEIMNLCYRRIGN